MIKTAVSRFRALGVVADGDSKSDASAAILGRTLAMAFVFEQTDQTGQYRRRRETFGHRVDVRAICPSTQTAKNLDVEVYITSDSGRTLNRLDLGNLDANAPSPTISADVRFDKMVLLGLYPSNPVVTGMRYRTAGVLSMKTVLELSRPSGDKPGMGLTEILDQFGKLSQG